MSLLAEVRLATAAGAESKDDDDGRDRNEIIAAATAEAAELYARLSAIDPVRANYYAFRRAHVLGQLAPQPQTPPTAA